ncbi:MAG: biotin--[acetyl-CoA-carboxylase] ligase [Caulobacteraceae bacterium]|nr:biotin--[acetyl-CoA-carboxylase] ligase [Caulobacteraceae bacterium]
MNRTAIPVLDFDQIDSTNAEARRRAEAGEAGPLWITAGRQTAGRGRRGRAWSTEPGNLAATLLTAVRRPPAEAAQTAFVAALAIVDLCDAFAPSSLVSIKWPNDVLIAGAKVAGVLIESGSLADGRLWLAVGCGVNLAHAPSGTPYPATSLAAHLRDGVGAPPCPAEAMGAVAASFRRWMQAWDQHGFTAIAEAWTARAGGLGGPCVARLGTETVEGVAEGLDVDGALKLRLRSGDVRRITAGDVFFEAAA